MTQTNRHLSKIFLIFFIFTITLIVTSILFERTLFDDESKLTALDNAENKVFEREEFFNGFLHTMKADIHALASSSAFVNFLDQDNEATREKLKQLLFTLGKFHEDITQLRYIDKNGMEVIRLQRNENNTFTFVPKEQLQDKSKRYYFINAKERKQGEIHFSALDLNIEHEKVEIPFNPTIRTLMPMEKRGEFYGLLVVNHTMTEFLKTFANSPLYDVILADDKGHPIFHYKEENSWGAYKKEKYTIKSDFPEQYQEILSHDFLRTDRFVSKKLDLDIANKLYLILQFKQSLYDLEKQKSLTRDIALALIVLLFSGIGIFFIIRVFKDIFFNFDEIQRLNDQLEEQARIISKNSIYSQTDLKGIITDASDAFCELSGYSREELIGKPHNIVRHPDMPSSTFKEIWNRLKNEESWDGEILNRKKDGSPYWVYSMIAPYSEGNKLVGYISNRVNITSEKEIELQDRLLREKEKLSLLGEMFGNITHQWKQPLGVISAASNGMRFKSQLGTLDASTVDQYTNSIEKSIQFLTETINTFKNYVQGKKEFKHYPLQEEIEKVLTIMEPMIKDNNITFISNLHDMKEVSLGMTTNELAQVIMVLISNAKDIFEEKNTQEPWIRLELLKDEEKIVLSVEDNGGGIPDEILPQLFSKYFTTKDEHKGTGLGLYMSKEIIEESFNGKLYVKNTENGAKFFIELPL